MVGVYPFEFIKQIQSVIGKLGFGQKVTPEQSRIARDAIISLGKFCAASCSRNSIEISQNTLTHPTGGRVEVSGSEAVCARLETLEL